MTTFLTQSWKLPHMAKGVMTRVPVFNAWRLRHATTGGTNSSRYCYAVWLRHLVTLNGHGFNISQARVGELGPGDTIGTGLAALLCGAGQYVGLDAVPFSAKANLKMILDELASMYVRREPIPDGNEFPKIRPKLDLHEFPHCTVDLTNLEDRADKIRQDIEKGIDNGEMITYRAPWASIDDIAKGSLDLVFSQGVLQCIDGLEETFQAIFAWLKPGGFSSHVIGCWAAHLSPYWNGLWSYSDWEWNLVRGRREFLFNRQPLTTYLDFVKKTGFEILLVKREYDNTGLDARDLAPRFRTISDDDLRTRGAMLILRKPR